MRTIIGDLSDNGKSENFDSKAKLSILLEKDSSKEGFTMCNFSTFLDEKQPFYHL